MICLAVFFGDSKRQKQADEIRFPLTEFLYQWRALHTFAMRTCDITVHNMLLRNYFLYFALKTKSQDNVYYSKRFPSVPDECWWTTVR